MPKLIGGPHDGHVVNSELPHIELPVHDERAKVGYAVSDSMNRMIYRTAVYKLEKFRGERHTVHVYRYIDICVDLMVDKLAKNYQSIPEDRHIDERKAFEKFADKNGLPLRSFENGMYENCATQMAWLAWLESALHGRR